MKKRGIRTVLIKKFHSRGVERCSDYLAVEEPLEIRLGYKKGGNRVRRSISITMCTPGKEKDLAVGFLFTEGILAGPEEIKAVSRPTEEENGRAPGNVVLVDLKPGVPVALNRLERHFYTTSSCGVCGKSSLEALRLSSRFAPLSKGTQFPAEKIRNFPESLKERQSVFERTGGIHAAALFDAEGGMLVLREDVGRHNAVDKLIGHELSRRPPPFSEGCLLVSGRTSFEILQKALAAGIAVVAGVGAPSSLAVEVANAFDMTLLGFVFPDRFNIYSGPHRVVE